ncbi:hypothetical protein ACJA23_02250 [Mycoplasma corogypsi]|uniref:hypothetical protein n=1 Tax=Mycoplasma corogypsi TaxID=2106 RepID=UPI003872CEC8
MNKKWLLFGSSVVILPLTLVACGSENKSNDTEQENFFSQLQKQNVNQSLFTTIVNQKDKQNKNAQSVLETLKNSFLDQEETKYNSVLANYPFVVMNNLNRLTIYPTDFYSFKDLSDEKTHSRLFKHLINKYQNDNSHAGHSHGNVLKLPAAKNAPFLTISDMYVKQIDNHSYKIYCLYNEKHGLTKNILFVYDIKSNDISLEPNIYWFYGTNKQLTFNDLELDKLFVEPNNLTANHYKEFESLFANLDGIALVKFA